LPSEPVQPGADAQHHIAAATVRHLPGDAGVIGAVVAGVEEHDCYSGDADTQCESVWHRVKLAPLTTRLGCRPADETKSRPTGKRTVMQPEGPSDMSALLAQAQQMQQQLMEAQEQLANTEVHGQAGGGLVQVTMKGSGEVVFVAIDPKVVDPDDIETLQDLIVGALADASKQMTILAQSRLGPLAGRLGL
jgi:DNA-binding YbaB/EbfC family protein